MRQWLTVSLLVVAFLPCVSVLAAYAVKHRVQPQEPVQTSRLQLNCDAGGLYIFEDFPTLGRSESAPCGQSIN